MDMMVGEPVFDTELLKFHKIARCHILKRNPLIYRMKQMAAIIYWLPSNLSF